jgi:NADH-quinone oxidoreductase subunit L
MFVYGHDVAIEIAVMVVSSVIGVSGLLLARRWYHGATLPTAPVDAGWHKLLTNKYYVDEIYDAVFIRPLRALARGLYKVMDVAIVDGLLVRGPAKVVGFIGNQFRTLQNGDMQAYVTVIVLGLVTAILFIA